MTERTVPKPGLYEDIPFETYCQWDAVNNSVLKILSDTRKCPAHAKEYIDNGRPDTPALKFGRALDCFLLEPTRWVQWFSVCPDVDRRTKAGKTAYAEFEVGLQDGQEVVTQSDFEKIQTIYNRVSQSMAMRLIQGGVSQVCAVWIDPETELLCKARYDYYQPDIPMITDVKSAMDASPDGFAQAMFKFSYFQQAAFYTMGHEVLTDEEPCFAIFAIEKDEPFVHGAYQVGDASIKAGRNAARKALRKYKECVDSGQWPLYSDKITILDIPKYALEKFGVNPYQE